MEFEIEDYRQYILTYMDDEEYICSGVYLRWYLDRYSEFVKDWCEK